jgi:hypothetical protein
MNNINTVKKIMYLNEIQLDQLVYYTLVFYDLKIYYFLINKK